MTTLTLRAATAADAERLWRWANDPAARAASLSTAPIPWEHHLQWFASRLADRGTALFIAEHADGSPCGTVRFESRDGWRSARISFAVAREARGGGVGRTLVAEGSALVLERYPDVALWGEVRRENAPSRRIFASLGWDEEDDDAERPWTVWRRPAVSGR